MFYAVFMPWLICKLVIDFCSFEFLFVRHFEQVYGKAPYTFLNTHIVKGKDISEAEDFFKHFIYSSAF